MCASILKLGLYRSWQSMVLFGVAAIFVAPWAGAQQLPTYVPRDAAPVGVQLDELELRVVSLEASGSGPRDVKSVEASAQAALASATTSHERIRARRILRRLKRIAEGQSPVPYPNAQANYESALIVSPTSQQAVPSIGFQAAPGLQASPGLQTAPISGTSNESPLAALARTASRLAQYGAPPAQYEASCEFPPQPTPMTPGTMSPAYTVVPAPGLAPVVAVPPPTRHYLSFDALGWWMKGDYVPPLVTSSPASTALSEAGVLGAADTSILFGNQYVNKSLRWGGRVQGGVWLDDFQTFAVEGHYWGFPAVTTSFTRTSVFSQGAMTDPILARPFFDADPGAQQQDAAIVAAPGIGVPPLVINLDGTVNVQEKSQIQSAGLGGRRAIGEYNRPIRLFLIGAYRFLDLDESLTISSASSDVAIPMPIPVPGDADILVVDSFTTRNIFNGGELGLGTEFNRKRWSIIAETRFAIGNMYQKVTINGRTSAVYDVFQASYEGGLLAQPSNIGTFTQNRFAFIPQTEFKLGYQVLPRVRISAGYNFTYISSVLRPGKQVDTNVNTTQVAGGTLVGDAVPGVLMKDTSLWLQGFTTGLDFRF